MYLLDTNILKLFLEEHPAVVRRVVENFAVVWVSSVAAEEMLAGRLSGVNKARAPRTDLSLPKAHKDFVQTLEELQQFQIAVYSRESDALFRTFSAKLIRNGSQDCRIAAQVCKIA